MMKNLQNIIDLHEKMRGAYFFSPPSFASGRRSYENRNSLTTNFIHDGQSVRVEQDTRCSCRNVYYSMKIYVNGQITGKNIRFIKSVLKNIAE